MIRYYTVLLKLSIACGALYFLTLGWQPYPGSLLIKGLSVAALALLARSRSRSLLALGLGASAIGDVLLDATGIDLFIPGLLAFLIAHLFYTIFFVTRWESPLRIWRTQRLLLAAVIAYAVVFTAWLAPGLGPLKVPVAFYICAITCMVCSAIAAKPPGRVILGAVLFLLSDSLLAVAKFKGTFPLRHYLVWGTYYLGQYCIATGALSGHFAAQRRGRSSLLQTS